MAAPPPPPVTRRADPVPVRAPLARLALLMAFSSIATDLYLPALPRIAGDFAVPAGAVEASVATFLAGFVAGQLAWGPAGDRWGRRRPMLAGVALFLVASIGCALAQGAVSLGAWRLVQGFGGAAAVVLARAVIRDLHEGDAAARALSSAIALMALAPLLGPLVGAQILRFGDWPAIFWTLAVLAVLALFAAASLPETRAPADRSAGTVAAAYGAALGNPGLRAFAAIGAAYYAGMFAFIAAAPAIFMTGFGFSPTLFGGLLMLGTALVILANVVNIRLVSALGYARTLMLGTCLAALGGAGAVGAAVLAPGAPAPLIGALMLYMAMAGLIVANSLAGALDSLPAQPGAASALAGAAHFAGGGIGAGLAAVLVEGDPQTLGWILACCAALATVGAREGIYKPPFSR